MLELLKRKSGCNRSLRLHDVAFFFDLAVLNLGATLIKVLDAGFVLLCYLARHPVALFLPLFEGGLSFLDPALNHALLSVDEDEANVVLRVNVLQLRLLLRLFAHVARLFSTSDVVGEGNVAGHFAVASLEEHLHHIHEVASVQGWVARITQHSLCAELSLGDGHDLIERQDDCRLGGEALEGQQILVSEQAH